MKRCSAFAGLAALLAMLPALAGCATGANEYWVEIKGRRFAVEVADDHEERSRGLMFRDALEPDRGMLFLHDSEQPLAFWMKNTRIPLDILYFDAGRRLVSVQARVPPCSLDIRCPNYPSEGPAQYVLELNAGLAGELGVAAGDTLEFGPGIPGQGSP